MIGDQTVASLVSIVGALAIVLAAIITVRGARGKEDSQVRDEWDQRIDDRVDRMLARYEAEVAQAIQDAATAKSDAAAARTEAAAAKTEAASLRGAYDRMKSAVASILRAIAAQWPTDHGPDLDPKDIAALEDTIPAKWIRKKES